MRLGALRRQLSLLFGLLIAAQAIALMLLCVRIQDCIALRTELRESGLLRTELNGLRAAVIDAETGQRGFVITGQEEFLQPYRAALLTLKPRLERLRALTAQRVELQRQMIALASLLKVVQGDMVRLVDVRRREGFAEAQQILASGAQREGMDQLRQLTVELDELEQRRAEAQEQSHQRASSALMTLAFFGLCGGMLLTIGLGMFARVRLGSIGAPLGKRLVELARELRTAGKAALRSLAPLITLSQSNAKTKAEVQATLEITTRTAKDLSTMAMEVTRSVQLLTGAPRADQKEFLAAEVERVVTLAVRIAQCALSIELTTHEQHRLLESAGAFEAQLEQSVKSVEQAAQRARQTSKELVALVQELPSAVSSAHPATASGDGTSNFEIFPIQT